VRANCNLYFIKRICSRQHFSTFLAQVAFFICVLINPFLLEAQEPEQLLAPDTIIRVSDTLINDTIPQSPQAEADAKFALEAKVAYKSADSLYFDLTRSRMFLFMNAEIQYQNINLKAHYIEIDFNTNTLHSTGLPDSLGVMHGTPVFTEGDQSFMANTMSYNFDTKRGFIQDVITQEGEGFLHGKRIKKMEDDITNVQEGSYTTCNLDCPHFEFRYQKAKVIPSDKIVTGPVFLVIEDVPLPLAIPFGFFPNKKGQASGIKIPTYGESNNRGFYFENGGYYWGISDYMELYLLGDIYTRGSWALKPSFNYRKRYKYNGSFNLSYAINKTGEEGTPAFQESRDFAVRWNHNQDTKAHPTQRFSANVNVQSSKFNRFNPVSSQNYLSNTFQSSISYQRSFGGRYFLNVSATHSQNTSTNRVTMTLPDISFNASRFYPFRRKTRVGALRWYENISVNYTMNARNQVTTDDSLFFRPETLKDFRNGVRHSIPVSSNIKVLNHFNLTNSFNFTERWYTQRFERKWVNDALDKEGQLLPGFISEDTLNGFYAVRDFSYTASLNTTLYGMMQFRKGYLRAVRHVMNPSVGFSFRPDFGSEFWNYYGEVQRDTLSNTERYSFYRNSIYGVPPEGKSGSLNFSLSNNLEIKVRSKRDTITGERKIKLIDNLSINTSYDMARDSLRWSDLSISARTTLFRNLQVQFTGRYSPYAFDTATGTKINKFVWETDRRILRRENNTWNFSMRYSINSSTFGGSGRSGQEGRTSEFGNEDELDYIVMHPDEFIDWNQDWNLNIDASLRLTSRYLPRDERYESTTVKTLSFSGDVNITPKWKVGFRSGYDFQSNKFTYTSFNFYRDLHCWEMRFNWIPTGGMKSWNFQINVRSQILQDLKLSRRKDFRDF
jgi:lipopolysaccharide assembly outer membrane protein LptD (OstA)